MWFLIKILIAILAFFVRLKGKFGSRKKAEQTEVVRDIPVSVHPIYNKENLVGTVFEIPFDCRAIFKLTEETGVDTFFKQLGMANELQTGDYHFDWNIYVASDSPAFKEELKKDAKARQLILELLRRDCKFITCDGKTLSMRFPEDKRQDKELISLCVDLYQQLSDLDQTGGGIFHDPFAYKIILVESVIWSLSIYAYSSFFEWQFFSEAVHLDFMPLLKQGLLVGFVLAALLFGFIVFILRGSSRGHRILVESFVVLALSIPVGGIAAIGDINTQLDSSESVKVVGKVTDLYSRKHKGRKNRTYYTYHLHVQPEAEPHDIQVPRHITISSETYGSLIKNGIVTLEIGRGRLNHPWFRSIRPGSNW